MVFHVWFFWMGIWLPLYFVGVVWFVARHKLPPIHCRGWTFVVLTITWATIDWVYFAVHDEARAGRLDILLPCALSYTMKNMYIPLFLQPIVWRAVILYFIWDFNQAKLRAASGSGVAPSTRRFCGMKVAYRTLTSTFTYWCLQIIYCLVNLIVIVLLQVFIPLSKVWGIGDACGGEQLYLNIVQILFLWIPVIAFSILLWNTRRDGYCIKQELGVYLVTTPTIFILWGLTDIITLPESLGSAMVELAVYTVYFTSLIYPIYLTYRPYYQRISETSGDSEAGDDDYEMESGNQKKGRMEGRDEVLSIVKHSPLFEAFKQHLTDLWCLENLLFFMACNDYRNAMGGNRLEMSLHIKETFLNPDSALEVNIDQELKDKIIAKIQNAETVDDLFEEAERHVLSMLVNDSLFKFRASGQYNKLLAEAGIATPLSRQNSQRSSNSSGNLREEPRRTSDGPDHSISTIDSSSADKDVPTSSVPGIVGGGVEGAASSSSASAFS